MKPREIIKAKQFHERKVQAFLDDFKTFAREEKILTIQEAMHKWATKCPLDGMLKSYYATIS